MFYIGLNLNGRLSYLYITVTVLVVLFKLRRQDTSILSNLLGSVLGLVFGPGRVVIERRSRNFTFYISIPVESLIIGFS